MSYGDNCDVLFGTTSDETSLGLVRHLILVADTQTALLISMLIARGVSSTENSSPFDEHDWRPFSFGDVYIVDAVGVAHRASQVVSFGKRSSTGHYEGEVRVVSLISLSHRLAPGPATAVGGEATQVLFRAKTATIRVITRRIPNDSPELTFAAIARRLLEFYLHHEATAGDLLDRRITSFLQAASRLSHEAETSKFLQVGNELRMALSRGLDHAPHLQPDWASALKAKDLEDGVLFALRLTGRGLALQELQGRLDALLSGRRSWCVLARFRRIGTWSCQMRLDVYAIDDLSNLYVGTIEWTVANGEAEEVIFSFRPRLAPKARHINIAIHYAGHSFEFSVGIPKRIGVGNSIDDG